MPIKAAVVSEERKRLAAQGRLSSAGRRGNDNPTVPTPSRTTASTYEDDSATSSDDDNASTSSNNVKATVRSGVSKSAAGTFVDPNEDFAAYTKKVAQQEWLYATGQAGAVPSPPPKQKLSAAPQSPAAAPRAARPTPTPPPPSPPQGGSTTATAVSKSGSSSAAAAQQAPSPAFLTDKPVAQGPTDVVSKGCTPTKPAGPGTAATTAIDAPPPQVPPPQPSAADLVTEEEESANPGRRDFLKLLDLLADDDGTKRQHKAHATEGNTGAPSARAITEGGAEGAPAAAAAQAAVVTTQKAKPPSHMNMEQMTEFFFNQMYNEWLESEADVTFLAAEQWHRAEAMAMLEKSADGMDIGYVHQRMRQVDHQGDARNETLQRSLRHNAAIARLELYVVSEGFVQRVNLFLHKHHPLFLTTMVARERGEHQHEEYDVWAKYGKLMEQLVVGDLKRHVDGFDEEEFFSTLFESENSGDGERDAPKDAGGVLGGLSIDAWEIILSFLRFEHFCALMDDYISVHYGVVQPSGSSGVTGVVGALRRSPPPTTASSRSSTVAASDTSRRPTSQASSGGVPTVGATKPKGGASVKVPPSAQQKR